MTKDFAEVIVSACENADTFFEGHEFPLVIEADQGGRRKDYAVSCHDPIPVFAAKVTCSRLSCLKTLVKILKKRLYRKLMVA